MHDGVDSSYRGGVHGGGRWHDACGEWPAAAFLSEALLPATGFEGGASPYHFVAPPAHYEGRPWHWPEQLALSPAQRT